MHMYKYVILFQNDIPFFYFNEPKVLVTLKHSSPGVKIDDFKKQNNDHNFKIEYFSDVFLILETFFWAYFKKQNICLCFSTLKFGLEKFFR